MLAAIPSGDAVAQAGIGPAAPRGGTTIPNLPKGGDLGPPPVVPELFDAPSDAPGERSPAAGITASIPNELCVVFPPNSDPALVQGFADDLDLEMVRDFTMQGLGLRIYLMRLADGADPEQMLESAAADQRPLWVQRNFIYRSGSGEENEQQYALRQVRADVATGMADGGAGIRVALIDSGVDTGHEAFAGARIEAINVVEADLPVPPEIHGTVLASILVGQGPLYGIVPRANLIAIRAFHEVDTRLGLAESSSFLLALGIETAIRAKAQVINLSLTGPQDRLVAQLVNDALMRRSHMVAAAGNEGPKASAAYPAAQDGVIAVTATDIKDRLYVRANHGDYISVAAPGVDILAAKPGGAYDFFSGTSMATGYVSGLAALLLSVKPDLGVSELRRAMETTAVDLGAPARDPEFGAGRIDAAAALETLP